MLYVDGMNGVISHSETVKWLYTLIGSRVSKYNIVYLQHLLNMLKLQSCYGSKLNCLCSQFRLVVKTALKLLLVFVEYTETNAQLLMSAVQHVDRIRSEF